MRFGNLAAGITVAGVLALAGQASAFVFWSVPDGSTANFDFVGGGSDFGLFGDPVIVGNTFKFTPQAFRAISNNGNADAVSDRLEVTLIAHVGKEFTGIRVRELGDYSILGSGAVFASGLLLVSDINPNGQTHGDPVTDALDTNPAMPLVASNTSGLWTGEAFIDLSALPPEWVYIKLVLQNNLQAVSAAGSSALIQKKSTDVGIEIEIIPAPAGLGLLGIGGLIAARRRR